jgi:hypothetical protein
MKNIEAAIIKDRLSKYPWNFKILSKNPFSSIKMIEQNIELPWDWEAVSKRKDLTWSIIKNNLNLPWDWMAISKSSAITWDIFKENRDLPWNIKNFNYNENMTWDIIFNNIDIFRNNFDTLGDVKKITWDIIKENLTICNELVNWPILSFHNYGIDLEIVKNLPDKQWNWNVISSKDLPLQFIIDHIDKPWDWTMMHLNRYMTYDVIKNHIDFTNKYRMKNISFAMELSAKHINEHNFWCWDALSTNKYIAWSIILDNIKKPWNWSLLSYREDLTWTIVQNHLNKSWDWKILSGKFDFEIIKNNPRLPWDLDSVSYNKKVTWSIIINNLEYPWNWNVLSNNKNISWTLLQTYPILNNKLNWFIIYSNPYQVDIAIIENNPGKPWNWNNLSYHPNLKVDFIDKYKNENWNWDAIALNNSNCITADFILNNFDKFNINKLHRNYYLTLEIIDKYKDKPWDWDNLSYNFKIYNIESEFNKKAREHMAAYKILYTWLRSYYNPNYLICKKRLYKEYLELL